MTTRPGARPLAVAAAVVSLLAGACGRKATVEDCERIVERIAELHLQGEKLVPPQELEQRVKETQEELHSRALSQCVGKRIPKHALECLVKAETAQSAIEDCL